MTFNTANDSICGKQLVTNKVLPGSQVYMSSNDKQKHSALLYGEPGWCADPSDADPFILVSKSFTSVFISLLSHSTKVDMLLETKITGFMSQGSPEGQPVKISVLHGKHPSSLSRLKHRGHGMVLYAILVPSRSSQVDILYAYRPSKDTNTWESLH